MGAAMNNAVATREETLVARGRFNRQTGLAIVSDEQGLFEVCPCYLLPVLVFEDRGDQWVESRHVIDAVYGWSRGPGYVKRTGRYARCPCGKHPAGRHEGW